MERAIQLSRNQIGREHHNLWIGGHLYALAQSHRHSLRSPHPRFDDTRNPPHRDNQQWRSHRRQSALTESKDDLKRSRLHMPNIENIPPIYPQNEGRAERDLTQRKVQNIHEIAAAGSMTRLTTNLPHPLSLPLPLPQNPNQNRRSRRRLPRHSRFWATAGQEP
jgi:hypothetical protein